MALLLSGFSFVVYAEDETADLPPMISDTVGYGEGIYCLNSNARATDLITRVSLTIAQVENHGVRVNFATGGIAVMGKIGGKNLTVQRWEGGEWVDVCSTDVLIEDRSFYSGSYYSPTNLPTGYYYRAIMTHYAKEQGWFFPASQSFYNETTAFILQK